MRCCAFAIRARYSASPMGARPAVMLLSSASACSAVLPPTPMVIFRELRAAAGSLLVELCASVEEGQEQEDDDEWHRWQQGDDHQPDHHRPCQSPGRRMLAGR